MSKDKSKPEDQHDTTGLVEKRIVAVPPEENANVIDAKARAAETNEYEPHVANITRISDAATNPGGRIKKESYEDLEAAEPKEKVDRDTRLVWTWVILTVALLGIAAAAYFLHHNRHALSSVNNDPTKQSSSSVVGGNYTQVAMGQTFDHKGVDFTAVSLADAQNVGDVKPKGAFKVLTLTVNNKSSQPVDVKASEIDLIDSHGTVIHFSEAGTKAESAADRAFEEKVAPGQQATGKIVYDVPVGTPIQHIEFGGGIFTPGDRVNL